jgi:hypothetical protein
LGKNFVVLAYTTRTADVYAYDKSIKPIENVPIVSGATAYDCPRTKETYILVFHESLYYGQRLDHSLINPNQVRHSGVEFWDNPYDDTRDMSIATSNGICIPLRTQGTKVLFRSRSPTSDELENCLHIDMTSRREWNPTSVQLREVVTDTPLPWKRYVEGTTTFTREYLDPRSDEAMLDHIDPLLVNLNDGRAVKESSSSRYDDDTLDVPVRRTFTSTERHSRITAEELAERLGIGVERAKSTLRATIQRGTRSAILPLSRRYRADRMFQQRRLNLHISSDTAWFKVKSLRGNVASQIYFHKCGFATGYHMSKADDSAVGPTLGSFISEYGVPERLTVDGAAVQIGRNTKFMDTIRRNEINYHVSHPRRPNENPAEGGIREIKRRIYRIVQKYGVPMRLWDYVLDYAVGTMNVMTNSSRYSNGRTPLEVVSGITPDITEYLDFPFYSWVYFRANAGLGPTEIGRWLGISHRTGPLMTYWVLPRSGRPISCDTVQRVTNAEMQTDVTRAEMNAWTDATKPVLEAKSSIIESGLEAVQPDKVFDLESESDEFLSTFSTTVQNALVPQDEETSEGLGEQDPYVDMEIGLRKGGEDELLRARVRKRALDDEGNPIGRAHSNPLLDTREYEVEYADGERETLTANILAENILAQVDEDGHRQLLLDEIVEHRTLPDAIPKDKGLLTLPSGAQRKIRTTRGWELFVQWKDGSSNWIPLKDLKESYPVELAEYARNNRLLDEPVFAWWVNHTLRKRDRILQKVKSKYWERTHKYGIEVPKTINDAKRIDSKNGNTLWTDAVRLEMKNVRIAFDEHHGDVEKLVGYEEITGHLVFDVKLGENFRRKARFCADGHKTKAPAAVTYSTVVGRDSVRILLTIAALNDLDVLGGDVQNAFLQAPNREKCWMRAGPEFGHEEGKVFIVSRALYGLKSASASFRAHAASMLQDLGFKSSHGDPDVWLRPAVKSDGEEYYEYVLMYVDDILAISVAPGEIMGNLRTRMTFKNDKVEEPSNYLGARLAKKQLEGRTMWTMTSVEYVNAALKTLEESIAGSNWRIPSRVQTPMSSSYTPELDGTPELDHKDRTRFQELIGILRWGTEIGRVDILHEVSVLSQYQACPRQGHLEQVLHIFGYLKRKPKLTLYFDPRLPNIDYTNFKTNKEDFAEHYRDAKEELPFKMPKPRGRSVSTTAFVDASHAANKKTRRSHSGHILFINSAPILWYSKRQNTVEASTFSSEFIALRTCVEAIVHLRFKLRMFGVPLLNDDATHVFCDNETVVRNSSHVESTLDKKHNSLAYHYVRWHVAAGVISLSWIASQENLADAMTKRLAETVRDHLFGNWTY